MRYRKVGWWEQDTWTHENWWYQFSVRRLFFRITMCRWDNSEIDMEVPWQVGTVATTNMTPPCKWRICTKFIFWVLLNLQFTNVHNASLSKQCYFEQPFLAFIFASERTYWKWVNPSWDERYLSLCGCGNNIFDDSFHEWSWERFDGSPRPPSCLMTSCLIWYEFAPFFSLSFSQPNFLVDWP